MVDYVLLCVYFGYYLFVDYKWSDYFFYIFLVRCKYQIIKGVENKMK